MSFASLVVHVILLMLVCWLGSELLASDDRLIRRVFGKLSVLFGMYALMCLLTLPWLKPRDSCELGLLALGR